MIDRETLDQIHARIVAGDVTASSDLFRIVHGALTAALRKRVGTLMSWDDAADVATDAIVEYTKSPQKFDPSRSGLFGYLLLIARGDALNLVRDAGNARKNLARVVELATADGNTFEEAPDVRLDADRILRDHHTELIRDDGDEAVLRLYLQGEKETAAYAEALGLSGLSASEQQKVVKGWKDRIEQRLKRLREVLK
jgi:DNA-directed RNA polymerase specialized sigma24 family protein